LTPELQSEFTVAPGSKLLLHQVQQDEEHKGDSNNHIQQPFLTSQLSAASIDQSISSATNMPSAPFLLQPNLANNKSGFHASSSPPLPLPSPPRRTQSDEVSVKGGKIFQTLFPKSPTDTSEHLYTLPLLQRQTHRQTKSMDELNGSKRVGQGSSYSSSTIASPSKVVRHIHSLPLSPPHLTLRKPPPPPTISLAAAVASSTITRSSASPFFSRRSLPNYTLTPANRSYGTVTEEDDEDDVDDNDEEEESSSLQSDRVTSLKLPLPAPPSVVSKSTTTPMSLAVLLSQRQQQNSSGFMSPPPSSQQYQQQQQQQQVLATMAPPSPSPNTSAREMKKTFTQFHNSATYAQDSTSAFLGDEPSTRRGTAFHSLLQQQRSQSNDECDTGASATEASADGSLALDKHLYSSRSSGKLYQPEEP
jgi:hypothetical protein